jgi:hypothetical protein
MFLDLYKKPKKKKLQEIKNALKLKKNPSPEKCQMFFEFFWILNLVIFFPQKNYSRRIWGIFHFIYLFIYFPPNILCEISHPI